MTWSRCLLATFLGVTLTADASAQFLQPVFGLPVVVQGGVDLQYSNRRVQINGYFPTGNPYGALIPVTPTPFGLRQVGPAIPYGSTDRRVTVTIVNPPPRVGLRKAPDLSGIDLDVEPASKIWGEKGNAVAKNNGPPKAEIVKAPKDEKKVEIAKVDPADKKAAALKPAEKPPAPPDGVHLSDDGIAAFRNGEFGVALLRFRQAGEADVPAPRALFLRAQACMAVGQYRAAVEFIQQGLKRQPNWPSSGFNPRVELYGNQFNEWKMHKQLLDEAQTRNPQDPDYHFLFAYASWFDGEREVAVAQFRQVRALSAEPRWADLFLKAAKSD